MSKKQEEKKHLEYGNEEAQIGTQASPPSDSQVSPDIDAKDRLRTVDAGLSADQVVVELDEKAGHRAIRKVDYRLIPLLSFLYL